MEVFRSLMTRLGLTVNERKSRLVKVPEESFDFLGYTIGRFYGKEGRSFIGLKPSKKAVLPRMPGEAVRKIPYAPTSLAHASPAL